MELCGTCNHAVLLFLSSSNDGGADRRLCEGRLPRLDVKTFNNCWLCYGYAEWLRSSHKDQFELWCEQQIEVKYKRAVIINGRSPFLNFFRSISGPMHWWIVEMFPSGRQEDEDEDRYGVQLSIASSEVIENFREIVSKESSERIDLTMIENWIKQCSKHQKCNTSTATWCPPRLLQITDHGRSARLVLTATKTSPALSKPYITLSHRWGELKYTKLTAASFDEMQKSVSVASLPQVFRDSFEIASELGIQFVWIDSLCIMQDEDKEDWRNQCQIMDKVYTNAFLNISATGCGDDRGNLLQREHCFYAKPIKLSSSGSSFKQARYVLDGRAWTDEISEAPLNMRGWVFQERHLARRVLHFGKNQLGWECCELEALETFPQGLPSTMVAEVFSKKEIIATLRTHQPGNEVDHKTEAYSHWRSLVEEYSKCGLTHQEDKLPALRGLANFFGDYLKDVYAAGMWKKSLLFDLAWYSDDPCTCDQGSKACQAAARAPSWSWASVDGEITFPQLVFHIKKHHVGNIDFVPLNATNSKTDAAKGQVVVAVEGRMFSLICKWNMDALESFQIDSRFNFPVHGGPASTTIHTQMTTADIKGQPEVFFLPLMTTQNTMYGLALSKISESSEKYRRIGCVVLPLCAKIENTLDGPNEASEDMIPRGLVGDWVEPRKAREGRHASLVGMRKKVQNHRVWWNRTTYFLYHHIESLRSERHAIEIH